MYGRGQSRERPHEEGGRATRPLSGERYPRDRGESSRGETERATWNERRERRERHGPARGPSGKAATGNAKWEQRRPPKDPAPPGKRETEPMPPEWGSLPAPTPELGRIAATWAAGQAAERNQWALELWRATEEKRAALVALRQSEETLHQVWRQLRPPWPGPPTAVPPASPQSGRTPGSTATGSGEAKRQGRCEQAGEQVMTNLWEGRAPGASGPQDEEAASHLGRQRWGHGGQDARAWRGH